MLINNFIGNEKRLYAVSASFFSDPARSKYVFLPIIFAVISGIIRLLPPMKKST